MDKIKRILDMIQALIDLHGDTWLAIFTTIIILRIALVIHGIPPLTMSESAAYASCVTAFAATNIGGPKT